MEAAQSGLTFGALADARAYARTHALREKAVCHITRRRGEETHLLVFDHVPDGGSGVQVVAGGLEPGEVPEAAAVREAEEETGRGGFRVAGYLGSAVWLNLEYAKRELRHFFHLTAPDDLPDTWEHHADDHLFRFRWQPLRAPKVDWELDAFLPVEVPEMTGVELPFPDACALATREGWRQKVLAYVTRAPDELLIFEEYPGVPEVPAGGVEPGEYPAQTAVRETLEESGLSLRGPVHLGSYRWTHAGKSQVWHYYWLTAPLGTPATWTHHVTGEGQDEGETLSYRWTSLQHPELLTGHRFEEALPTLRCLISAQKHPEETLP